MDCQQKSEEPPSSVVNTILGSLGHMEDTQTSDEELVAKNVAAIAYAGARIASDPDPRAKKHPPWV